MLYFISETKHGRWRRTWEELEQGGTSGRALSLSAAPPLPVWGGSPSLAGQWSHHTSPLVIPEKRTVLWATNHNNHNRETEEWGTCTRTHMPVLIIAVENSHPLCRPNRKQCYSKQTSTSCANWGLFTERPQSKTNVLSTASLSASFRRHYCPFAKNHMALFMLTPPKPKHQMHLPHWWPLLDFLYAEVSFSFKTWPLIEIH